MCDVCVTFVCVCVAFVYVCGVCVCVCGVCVYVCGVCVCVCVVFVCVACVACVLTHNALAVDGFSLRLRFLLLLLILLDAAQEVKTAVGVLHVLDANVDPLCNDPAPGHKK